MCTILIVFRSGFIGELGMVEYSILDHPPKLGYTGVSTPV